MTDRYLLLISARLDPAARHAVASGRWPRKDFFALAGELQADVIDYTAIESSLRWRTLRRLLGMPTTQALAGWTRAGRYASVFSDGEHIGIPFAALPRRRSVRHVMIAHLLSTPAKRAAFRWLRPARGLSAIVTHSPVQSGFAAHALSVESARLALLPYQVDTRFWSPRAAPPAEPLICTAGLEYRDYPTLIEAVRGLSLRTVIAAGSRWSRHRTATRADLPDNVELTSLDYLALRQLYAEASFVVVPLHDVDNQAGITTILEAMAMGKAVIVSATCGQQDVVRGRLVTAAGLTDTVIGGPAAFGVRGVLATDHSGLYVPPADAHALRAAITFLLDNPREAQRLGAAGRRLVEAQMNLEVFVTRIAGLVRGNAPDRTSSSAPAHGGLATQGERP